MNMMTMKSRFTNVLMLVLIVAILLTGCGADGKYIGKYIRNDQMTSGGVTISVPHYIFVFEGCQQDVCQQYETEVSEATWNAR